MSQSNRSHAIHRTALDVIRSRRTARVFAGEPVPDETVWQLIELAGCAPSAHHCQPWRFIVIRPGPVRYRLADAMARPFRRRLRADGLPEERVQRALRRSRQRIAEAPGLVILCLDRAAIPPAPTAHRAHVERILAIQSVALAGGTFLLACEALGLAAGWFSAPLFAASAVRRAIDVPATWEPQAMILFGGRPGAPHPRRRLNPAEVSRWY